MKRTLSLGLALAMAAFTPSLEAAPGKNQKGKGKGKAHAGAVAHRAPKAAHSKPKGPALAGRGNRPQAHRPKAVQPRAPKIAGNRGPRKPVARGNLNRGQIAGQYRKPAVRDGLNRGPNTAQLRDRRQRQKPSIAFGGTTNVRTSNVQNRVSIQNRNTQIYRPPATVYRNWDRGRTHEWNRHRYHWHNGGWVVLAPTYSYPSYTYGYDVSPTYSYEPSLGNSTVSEVQSALQREGYDPGPADGLIGSQTRDAIAAYQKDHGLAVSGRIDDALLSSLDLS